MTRTTEHTQLTQQQCWVLLRTAGVGRVSYTERALPVIRAVPFVVDGGSVVIALRPSSVRADLFALPTVVAFEAGEWTPRTHDGWSVHFIGKAQAVSDHDRAEVHALGLDSWIDGEPAQYVRISAEAASGTRVSTRVRGQASAA